MAWRDYTSMAGLSCRDFIHESGLSACGIIGIAAVLTPLLVLFGLKFGVVTSMLDQLTQDPRTRALQPIGQGSYDEAWFAALRSRPDVGFVLPNTRFLAATVFLTNPAKDLTLDAEFLPSADGDPLLVPGFAWPEAAPAADAPEPVILSQGAAAKLGAEIGTRVDGKLGRSTDSQPESVHRTFEVVAILPAARFERDGILVRLPMLLAAEDYREGYAVPSLDWPGQRKPDAPRRYASFRLYSSSIDDVAALRDFLLAHGVDATTSLADIELVQRLDRSLTLLFLIIAGLGSLGYLLAMTVSLWASVMRKQHDLSLLRLVGFSTGAIAVFPVVQAVLTGLFGASLASAVTLAVAPAVNRLFAGQVYGGGQVFRLLPQHFLTAFALTVAVAVAAACYGGARAARIAPGEGLRED